MAFDWLVKFQQETEKPPDYADRVLSAYQLGMRAKGSIVGVTVECSPQCCEAARQLAAGKTYKPDEAPRLPLPGCSQGRHCGCVYRPVMSYQNQTR